MRSPLPLLLFRLSHVSSAPPICPARSGAIESARNLVCVCISAEISDLITRCRADFEYRPTARGGQPSHIHSWPLLILPMTCLPCPVPPLSLNPSLFSRLMPYSLSRATRASAVSLLSLSLSVCSLVFSFTFFPFCHVSLDFLPSFLPVSSYFYRRLPAL